ncbi:MAG: Asp23/Gls24 family envelope stress response protein [Candidatus Omnitrophota bacterium]
MVVHQPSENGSVEINDQVLKQLILDAAQEIDGVQIVSNSLFDKFLKIFLKSRLEGIHLDGKKTDNIKAKLCVGIRSDLNLSEVTKEIQEMVMEKVKKTANISLNRVDIHIQSLDRRSQ